MQWKYVLISLLISWGLGLLADELLYFSDETWLLWLLGGGAFGQLVGLTRKLRQLQGDNQQLTERLKDFSTRFEHGTDVLYQRLLQVEQGSAAADTSAAEPVAAATVPEESLEISLPDLVELPLLPETLQVLETPAAPELAAQPLQGDVPETVQDHPAPEWRDSAGHSEPGLLIKALKFAKDWLLGGNTVLRVGVVLLFLGLAFLLRYTSEMFEVPVEMRYLSVSASALALLGLGWWLRLRNATYALVLQGAGVAVLYLTIFAALRLHPLLSASVALVLLILVTCSSAILAVLQNALSLAVVAALGGFAAPVLTSTGSGNHVALFAYFALLNSGIFCIAWFKAWRLLNMVGFIGTFGIGCVWGIRSYQPELLWSTEPFLLLFFFMYVGIGLLFSRRKLLEAEQLPQQREQWLGWTARHADYIDASVIFGPPLVGFALQYAVVRHIELAAAFSALGMGAFYLTLAWLLVYRGSQRVRLLAETYLALGVVFASLAIPLGLDARWTSAAWAVEGAGIYWLGLRQARPLARLFALFLQGVAVILVLGDLRYGESTLLEGSALGAGLLGVALLFSFWQSRQTSWANEWHWERRLQPLLSCVGLVFLYLMAPLLFQINGTVIVWAVAGLLTLLVGLRLHIRHLVVAAFVVQLLGGLLLLIQMIWQVWSEADGFAAGWLGLVASSLVGFGLVAGMLLVARGGQRRSDSRALSSMLLIGLVFINLAVLFVLSWKSAAAVWAGTALLVIWLSLSLRLRAGLAFGLVLQVGAGLAFFAVGPLLPGAIADEGARALAHSGFWTPVALALAALAGAWQLHRQNPQQALLPVSLSHLSRLLLVWGGAWWIIAGCSEIRQFMPEDWQVAALLAFFSASAAIWQWLAIRLTWADLAALCMTLIPAGAVVLGYAWHPHYHPAADGAWLGWLALFAVHGLLLWRLPAVLSDRLLSSLHVLGCWLVLLVLSLELRYLLMLLAEQYNAWRWLGWALWPCLYLLGMAALPRLPWPFSAQPRAYRLWAALPLAVALLVWVWLANIFSAGDAQPLPYLPLLNPLELGVSLVLLAVFGWQRICLAAESWLPSGMERIVQAVIGLSLFALLTAMVMRTAHHWAGVPWLLTPLLKSMLVQAGLSIVWTLIALPLMIVGHLRISRQLWLAGAVLITVVVAKLFFVELGNQGGLERVVSFIGVGVLLLVVGYFAPLPPQRVSAEEEQAK